MSQDANIKNWMKNNMVQTNVPYNEALWQKLDEQLVPVREAYQKKQKRRVAAYWTIAASVLLISAIGFYASQNNKTTTNSNDVKNQQAPTKNSNTAINTNTNIDDTNDAKNGVSTNVNNNQLFNEKNSSVNKVKKQPNTTYNNNEAFIANRSSVITNNKTSSTIETASIIKSNKGEYNNNETVIEKPAKTIEASSTKNIDVANNNNVITNAKKIEASLSSNDTETFNNNVTPVDTTTKKDVAKKVAPIASNITQIAKKEAVKVKPNLVQQPIQWSLFGGVNMASPFYKSGYVGGVLLEKQIQDKRIYAGVKVAFNKLAYQLIATKNSNITPIVADAVINKMTTIQLPFGYQFPLNKKLNNPAFLNVGFEPTLFTGIQTIYYDDIGVPGGVRTPVVNSPLLHDAINKFNVSFTVGVKKQLTPKVSILANTGYGLINITDKQYYNKVGSNNNLKYIQIGVMYKL